MLNVMPSGRVIVVLLKLHHALSDSISDGDLCVGWNGQIPNGNQGLRCIHFLQILLMNELDVGLVLTFANDFGHLLIVVQVRLAETYGQLMHIWPQTTHKIVLCGHLEDLFWVTVPQNVNKCSILSKMLINYVPL